LRIALEELGVGKDREAGSTAGLVAGGDRCRVEVGTDDALARAGLLDLGDHRAVALGDPGAQGRGKPARAAAAGIRRAGGFRLLADTGERQPLQGEVDLLALDGE